MRRFFFEPAQRRGVIVRLDGDESRHVQKVLRLTIGTDIELFDGCGELFSGKIVGTGRNVDVEITGTLGVPEEPGPELIVCQGLLKGEKMDMVVQKSTEMGVSVLQPVHTQRCQGKLNDSQAEKKLGRWQRISLAACKQSMRIQQMRIEAALELGEALAIGSGERVLRLMFWEEEHSFQLQEIIDWQGYDKVILLLGPEGGISEEEAEAAVAADWRLVSLGRNILRAETATLAAVAIVQHCIGRM